MAKRPTSELAAVGFLRKVLAGKTAAIVVTTLPSNVESFKDGAIQVQVVGGAPNVDVATAMPVLQVDCWVPSIKSATPQWSLASDLAEIVREAVYLDDAFGTVVSTPAAYDNVLVFSTIMLTEPRRVTADPASYARYTFDLQVNWVPFVE